MKLLWIAFGLAAAITTSAYGHGPERREDLVVTLDSLPSALRGVKAGLHQTLGLQLLVENKTGKQLEILDDAGKPFIRLGPDGAHADLASPYWRASQLAGGRAPAASAPAMPAPRWAKVSTDAAWGWFDIRLNTQKVKVPRRMVQAGREAQIGRWKVPVRFGGVAMQLSGAFRYAPPPRGYFETRLTSPAEISPGVTVMLLRGAVPGIYLDNRSGQAVTLYGAAGEPFLRIGPEGVHANVASPSWLASGKAETSFTEAVADAGAEPQWQLRSASSRFSWLEPRAASPNWEIGLRHGDETRQIAGVRQWIAK